MPEKISENIKTEIEKLVKDLNYHNYRYYVLDTPVISDEEYDRLYKWFQGALFPTLEKMEVGFFA